MALSDSASNEPWDNQIRGWYYDGDAAYSRYIEDEESSQMATTVYGEGTVTFYWKVSSEEGCDYLEFYIDGVRQDRISGEQDWQPKQYDITGSGIHCLLWQYVKDYSSPEGDDCGYVDCLQWTGDTEPQGWQNITYTYDPGGRRIEKNVDDDITKYFYDGGSVIAEYDGNSNLLCKYIYGAGVDKPICMIDVVDSNAVYYYHFDGLGSVVALSDSVGDTVQTYEYSVYGLVAAEDPNHPNPYMFTGRRLDLETGLYYYRARYYNPYIGRFMQKDPVGDGMNLYAYCGNNPLGRVDPSGLAYTFLYLVDEEVEQENMLVWAWVVGDNVTIIDYYVDIDAWCDASEAERFTYGIPDERSVGKELSERLVEEKTIDGKKYDKNWLYERLQFLQFIGCGHIISSVETGMKDNNLTVNIIFNTGYKEEEFGGYNGYTYIKNKSINIYWNPTWNGTPRYTKFPPLVGLMHELGHAVDFVSRYPYGQMSPGWMAEAYAIMAENKARRLFSFMVPGWEDLEQRPVFPWR